MVYRALADLVLITHFVFIVFVLAGGFLVLRWRWIAWAHVPAAIWGVTIELAGWICPLTPLENQLRRLGGEVGYTGGFLERYLLPLIYPAGLTREVQLVLGAAVVILNVVAYALVIRRARSVGA
ncbi:MAG: DUF2784 domain-containing protein [Gemmatimonadota bacterium]|nr:DUF2784 domain-containing protein [Gemmatimonadota bacterium]